MSVNTKNAQGSTKATKPIHVHIRADLRDEVQRRAAANRRTITAEVEILLEQALKATR